MCRKSKCAFLQEGDYCLMHKAQCSCGHQDARCRDGVTRLKEVERDSQHRYMKGLRICKDKAGVKGACLHPKDEIDRGKSVFLTCKRKHRFPTAERARSVAVYAGRKDGVPGGLRVPVLPRISPNPAASRAFILDRKPGSQYDCVKVRVFVNKGGVVWKRI